MRAPAVVAVCILLLPAAGGYWNQQGGDQYRSGRANLPDAPLDVIHHFRVYPEGANQDGDGMDFLETPYGLMAAYEELTVNPLGVNLGLEAAQVCPIRLLVDIWTEEWETIGEYPCPNGGKLLAYDPQEDLLLAAMETEDPATILRFIDPRSGDEVDSMGPDLFIPATPGYSDTGDWYLDDATIADGIGYAAFGSDTQRNRLQAFDLATREILWATGAGFGDLGLVGGSGQDELDSEPRLAAMHGATVTDAGIVVVTDLAGGLGDDLPGLVWLDLDGNQIGYRLFTGQALDGADARLSTSSAASGQGRIAAALFGSDLVLIDPLVEVPQIIDLPTRGPADRTANVAAPAWIGATVGAPTRSEIFFFTPGTADVREWPGYTGAEVNYLIGVGNEGWALTSQGTGGTTDLASLIRIDPATATTIQVLPLGDLGGGERLLPVSDPPGLIAWSSTTGQAVLLGHSDERMRPSVTIADLYPRVGDSIQPVVAAPDGATLVVAWGDGALATSVEAGLSHSYAEPGTYSFTATAVYPDGMTATTQIELFVGADPPRTWIEERFAPGNQDTTWGVIGVGLVLFGALVTVVARRVGRGRIAAGLGELAGIRDRSVGEPLAALRELQTWHGRQEDRLLRGRLTEDQFRVLENRGGRLMRSVTQAVLEPVAAALPEAFSRKLDAAYRDGFVDSGEVAGLRAAAAQLKLAAAKRHVLDGVFDAWSHGTP